MSLDAIERLNFFPGLRLDATDLRLEQAFHVAVRRHLTRALFSPGVAVGLEVIPLAGSQHHIVVQPGVAIDHLGREIILLEPVQLPIRGVPSARPGLVFGNYVVIQFREDPTGARSRVCGGSGGDYGEAPSRVRHAPAVSIIDAWPSASSGQIVLGQLDIDPNGCTLRGVITTVRRYAGPTRQQSARALALAGEKDINSSNGKTIRFHIEGGTPSKLTLHLKAFPFSSLYYSEMGSHTHTFSATTSATILKHDHSVEGTRTEEDGEHKHAYYSDFDGWLFEGEGSLDQNYIMTIDNPNNAIIAGGKHSHGLSGLKVGFALDDAGHTHTVGGTTGTTGATGVSARVGARYNHLTALQVAYDGSPITPLILSQLSAKPGQAGRWPQLGDPANAANPLANDLDGTGPIDLVALGVDLSPGAHEITLTLPANPAANGGQIHWNLYLE